NPERVTRVNSEQWRATTNPLDVGLKVVTANLFYHNKKETAVFEGTFIRLERRNLEITRELEIETDHDKLEGLEQEREKNSISIDEIKNQLGQRRTRVGDTVEVNIDVL